jgi:hypothetical protein
MSESGVRSARRREPELTIDDRRVPTSARGLAVSLRRLKGMLKRPLRLQRSGLQWHIVLVDRRRNAPHQPPSQAQLLSELSARLLAIDDEHAAAGMRQVVRLHDMLRRKGWSGVEMMSARELGRAVAQCELLASVEASPAMSMLVERLRILKAAAEVREERRAAARLEQLDGQVEVTETGFDAFHDTQRGWVDTVAPEPAKGEESAF